MKIQTLSSKLRCGESADYKMYYIWCPACNEMHGFRVLNADKGKTEYKNIPFWTFDGDVENPTFAPSLRYLTGSKCHLTVTKGRIQYHSDCPHALKNMTIDMVPIPEQ